jgi:SAM-dependent methyltransferase
MVRASASASQRLASVLDVVDETKDILLGRVLSPDVPDWCEARGWADYLLGLDDPTLERAESEGLGSVVMASERAPGSLTDLARRVFAVSVVDAPGSSTAAHSTIRTANRRRISRRKHAQVDALAALARGHLRRPLRVVDVGAGHGHLTRALAEALDVRALGLDRDADLVKTAQTLSDDRVRFERWDASSSPLSLERHDLVVGLHACGDLGDLIVKRVGHAGSDALLVSCCLQKIRAEARQPLSALGRRRTFLAPRPLLGLANLSARAEGVEGSMREIMASRRTRYALVLLLRGRGVDVSPGEETRGINRRQMRHGLARVADVALSSRGLSAADAAELSLVEARSSAEFAVIRRLSLPRAMLSRLLELAVVFDRAAALEDGGH